MAFIFGQNKEDNKLNWIQKCYLWYQKIELLTPDRHTIVIYERHSFNKLAFYLKFLNCKLDILVIINYLSCIYVKAVHIILNKVHNYWQLNMITLSNVLFVLKTKLNYYSNKTIHIIFHHADLKICLPKNDNVKINVLKTIPTKETGWWNIQFDGRNAKFHNCQIFKSDKCIMCIISISEQQKKRYSPILSAKVI